MHSTVHAFLKILVENIFLKKITEKQENGSLLILTIKLLFRSCEQLVSNEHLEPNYSYMFILNIYLR
jgi:hypothetical protein